MISCYSRALLLTVQCIVLSLLIHVSPSSAQISAPDPDTTSQLKHRHFFHYNINQPRYASGALTIMDNSECFKWPSGTASLASFAVRSDYQLPLAISPEISKSSSSQIRLGSSDGVGLTPNITDKETIVNLAKMTSDAYLFDPREPSWLNTSLGFNFTCRLGWKEEGLRGHVFTNENNSMVVVAFKGTSIDPRDKVSNKDRLNDVKLFSCCCGAQQPYFYAPVCNCSTGAYQCDSNCLTSMLLQNDTYYDAAMFILSEFKTLYPTSSFWVVGHSLGGSLASLVGRTFNIPSVSFEAPPERLPAERMGLLPINNTIPTDRAMAYHFGNTADPIYMGECNGIFSSCSFWGFSFESKCHSGKTCTYDTRHDKGWRSSVANHRINFVIEEVLKAYDDVPACVAEKDCKDCDLWNFS